MLLQFCYLGLFFVLFFIFYLFSIKKKLKEKLEILFSIETMKIIYLWCYKMFQSNLFYVLKLNLHDI